VFISTATASDERERAASVAVLPVGSFEQHGDHLPLSTDTLIASTIAARLADDYGLFLLSPVTIGCSHEHAGFPGTVSISASTLGAVVSDVRSSLAKSGLERLAIVNAHGGNYVLSHVVQEASVHDKSTLVLFPRSEDWVSARRMAGVETNNHTDMHAGEAETSILLAKYPELVRPSYINADETADERRHLLTLGMRGYTKSGVVGRPSLASAEKGERLLDAFSSIFREHMALLNA
jgi:creatinine amidohydrolase